jgi:hypothetical protein
MNTRQLKRTQQKLQKKEAKLFLKGRSKKLKAAVARDSDIPIEHIKRVFVSNGRVDVTLTEEGRAARAEATE